MPVFTNNGNLKRRKSNNFFTKIDISTVNFSDHVVSWDFHSHGIFLLVESDHQNDVIQYSFDGIELHGDLTPRLPSEAVVFDNRHQNKIWLRLENSGPDVRVRVEAWRNDV